uniref:Protein kinase domain-containing protein n=1 Tax=Ciona savignyi TaxID=51511 RepID=H2YSL9_CIOSA
MTKSKVCPTTASLSVVTFSRCPRRRTDWGMEEAALFDAVTTPSLEWVAVKCMEWSFGDTQWNRNMEKRLPDEIAVSLSMNHENIIRVHGVAVWPKSLGLVLDYIPGGQLEELLGNWSIDPLPWTVRLRISYETANGLSYLHNFSKEKRIVHGDIKPENILLTSDLHAKIADFGGA